MHSSYKLLFACVKFISIVLSLDCVFIYAQPKHSVDISYLVADVKYSQEHGLKICEVQHGSLSALEGDLFIFQHEGSIAPKIADFFDLFPLKKWAAGLIYPPLKRSLALKEWDVDQSLKALIKDPTYLECAALSPRDPLCIRSYAGIVYADFDIVRNFDFYCTIYPGIIFANVATFPYWRDKYAMNRLFDLNPELKQYKAEWKLYPKNYDSLLSERIRRDLPAELYVIKPRSEVLANGVIVVESKDLDTLLSMILEPSEDLKKHPDKKYAYWYTNNDDTLIIEKYYTSDVLCLPHLLNQEVANNREYHYDATMRLAFILHYEEKKMMYHSLGAFWKLPSKALEEEGTLNEKRISCCKRPFYAAVDQKLLQEVDAHMERAMLLLYVKMLSGKAQ